MLKTLCVSVLLVISFAFALAQNEKTPASGKGCQDKDARLVSGGRAGVDLYMRNYADRRRYWAYNRNSYPVTVQMSGENVHIEIFPHQCESVGETNGTSMRIVSVAHMPPKGY